MGTNVLGDNIIAAIDALLDLTDRTAATRALGNEIEDWTQSIAPWDSTITYSIENIVARSGGVYVSLQNGNLNKDPVSEPTWWSLAVGGNPFDQDLNTTDDVEFNQITGPLVGNAATASSAAALTGAQATAIANNTTHRGSDGKDHSDVGLNNTHRGSDGSDHSKVGANETSIGLNTTHRGSDGKDHSDVVLNNTHRGSDGKNHSDVVLNNTHRTGGGTDHADMAQLTNLLTLYDANRTPYTATGDWNNYVSSGLYRGSSLTNGPTTAWYYVLVQFHNNSYVQQTAWNLTGTVSKVYTRIKNAGSWTSWVLQTGITSGSNSNGEWVVFSDGLQVCWNQAFTIASTSGATWTHPAAFGSEPSSLAIARDAGAVQNVGRGTATATTTIFRIRDVNANTYVTGSVACAAIGGAV